MFINKLDHTVNHIARRTDIIIRESGQDRRQGTHRKYTEKAKGVAITVQSLDANI